MDGRRDGQVDRRTGNTVPSMRFINIFARKHSARALNETGEGDVSTNKSP